MVGGKPIPCIIISKPHGCGWVRRKHWTPTLDWVHGPEPKPNTGLNPKTLTCSSRVRVRVLASGIRFISGPWMWPKVEVHGPWVPCCVLTQCGLLFYHFFPLFSVVCIVIICLCLAGTVADLCVVQGSWKFWLLPDMPSDMASSLSQERGFSNEESAPLLRGNGYLASSDLSSQIQFKTTQCGRKR